MIDLSPTSKRGLELRGPLILSGGYGSEYSHAAMSLVSALVTCPTSLRPRAPARDAPRILSFPGGFLHDRGGANPGLVAVLQAQRHNWRRLGVPVILSLACGDERHWGEIARRVSHFETIVALELEVDEEADPKQAIRATRGESDLPILAKITVERVLEQAEEAIESGADTLTIGLAPRGSSILNGREWEGRIGGPAAKPLAMRALRLVAESYPQIPIVAAGGVQSAADVQEFIQAGASAVQIDAALWRDPEMLESIGRSFVHG